MVGNIVIQQNIPMSKLKLDFPADPRKSQGTTRVMSLINHLNGMHIQIGLEECPQSSREYGEARS